MTAAQPPRMRTAPPVKRPEESLDGQTYWHAYGGVRDDLGGCFQLAVIGPATASPDDALDLDIGGQPYLTSWDHKPSELEKEEVTPPEYRDEFGPLAHTIPKEDA